MKLIRNRRAFALVLVLIALVISSSMAVFFLTSVARERLGVNLYAKGAEVHHLAGMPVSRVIGQINAATKEGTVSAPVSWASQPGMIRTYDADGNLKNAHKLYSWDNPVESGAGFDPAATAQVPPSDWKDNPATYTDLNQQVNGIYPIVDPRAEKGQDPDNTSSPGVEGFSIDRGNSAVSASELPAPMPVKWLYVLEDGQMVSPTGATGSAVNITGATKDNPIVGRVAYWTDDETCKVNINTAGEGAYWDLPKAASYDELQFCGNTPVKGEFQRTAGHPAMTSLSSVFPETRTTVDRWTDVDTYRTEMEAIDNLTPRIRWGGSRGGTYPVKDGKYKYAPGYDFLTANPPPAPITMGTDRLYVLADDFWFKPDRQANVALDDNLNTSGFQRRLFFLTANSRAPETTLFETPRLSLWPITWPNPSSYYLKRKTLTGITVPTTLDPQTTAIKNNPWTTAEERLLAFCATLNVSKGASAESRYFFQRQDPDSPTFDWTNSKLGRNQELVKYLRALMNKKIPGFGADLASKWGADNADWIALNCFDYSRSLVNQFTAPTLTNGVLYSYTGVGSRYGKFVGVTNRTTSAYTEPNAKTVVPLTASLDGAKFYQTQGAFPSLEEVAVMFYATDRLPPERPDNGALKPGQPGYKEFGNPYNWKNLINTSSTTGYDNGTPSALDDVGARTTQMRAVMLLDFSKLMPGTDYYAPVFWVKVKGSDFTVNGSGINLLGPGGRVVQCAFDNSPITAVNYKQLFTRSATSTQRQAPKAFTNKAIASPTDRANVWSLVSDAITVDPNKTDFNFSGGEVTVEVYTCDPTNVDTDPTGDPNRLISSKTVNFGGWLGIKNIPTAPYWCTANARYNPNTSSPTVITWKLPDMVDAANQPLAGVPSPCQPDPYYRGFAKFATAALLSPGIMPVRTSPLVYVPETRDPRWAFAEYSPVLERPSESLNPTRVTVVSGKMQFRTVRDANHFISYLFQTDKYSHVDASGRFSGLSDLDESSQPPGRVSTVFRKRVASLNQRTPNSDNRSAFYIEGATMSDGDRNVDIFCSSVNSTGMEAMGLISPYDTVVSVIVDATSDAKGDPRLSAVTGFEAINKVITTASPANILPAVPSGDTDPYFPILTIGKQFHQLALSGTPQVASTGYRLLAKFQGTNLATKGGDPGASGTYQLGDNTSASGFGGMIGAELGPDRQVPSGADWTSYPGQYPDGGFLARPNQEYQQLAQDASWPSGGAINPLGLCMVPYYTRAGSYLTDNTITPGTDVSYFSPNSQIPSPVLLGTLPSSMTKGWQTLAFSPNPANSFHPGLASPPDHLLLDLFWMPVAEPYPISDQLSTAGKINLNYGMMPFSYIKRKTALYAALKSTWIYALPHTTGPDYKSHYWMFTNNATQRTRYPIDVAGTLKYFDDKFEGGDLFRSASQICGLFLYPADPANGAALVANDDANNTKIKAWWDGQKLTTDNGREEPYNAIYSRVTTKSNTFTVHWRVQSLRKTPNTDPAVWDEARDRRVSELRGSTLIERYIDPNADNIPDYAKDYATAAPLTNFYKWRVVSENYFQP